MNDTILTWNMANWITVLLMVGIGYTVVAMGAKAYESHKAKGAS